MEEKVIKHLNWCYYGIMVFTLVILSGMYYLTSRPDFEPLSPMEQVGMILQYMAMGLTLIAIPFGLYTVKLFKPDTYEKYEMNIALYYLLGNYQPMMWLAAMSAVAWYFTKPTLGKMEQEMTPKDPNEPTY